MPAAALLRGAWKRQFEVTQWPNLPHEPALEDPNIWTRLEQTRQWIAGADFHERLLRDTNAAAEGVERLWTRATDTLIGFFHYFTPVAWADETRLMVAAAWLPAVLGIIAFAILARAALARFNNWHVLFTLVFLLAVNPLTGYFTPGDVDRHGIVIVMWCGVLGLMLKPLTRRGAALAGVMLGVMLWGDIESLAPVGVVLAFAGYVALRKPDQRLPFVVMAVAAALTAGVALAAEMRVGAGLPWLLASGGFDGLRPVPTDLKPLLQLEWSIVLQHIWQPVLALALLLRLRRGRASDAALGAVLAACCFLMLAQVRFSYYAQVAAVLAIAPLLPVYAMQLARGLTRTLRPYAVLLGCCAVVIALAPPSGGTPNELDKQSCQAQMRYVIQTQQLQKRAGDGPRVIVAPADVAGDIIFFTPYRVIAGEYMREGKDMERLRAIVAEPKADQARALLKENNAELVFFCPAQAPKGSWLAGPRPAWLKPVEGMSFTVKKGTMPQLYAVQK
ncbi:MAG: hypothetical protein ACAH80_02905 [Alphaproteobacteria bacterium]